MYPFQNILFSTDFTANSRSALKYAAAFAQQTGATIFIHNAQEGSLPPQALKLSEKTLSEHGYDWVTAVKHEMEDIANSELLKNLKVQLILSEGKAATEIPRIVSEYNIDLVAMGTNARSGLGGGVGSNALAVMGQITCPLLLTRQSQHDFVTYKGSQTTIALNRILYATDLSGHDLKARSQALSLARTSKAKLYIMHAIGSMLNLISAINAGTLDLENRVRQDTENRLQQVAAEAADINTEVLVHEGRAYDEVLRMATEHDVDLIVIGAGEHRTRSFTLPGHNSERIVRGAPCPVLVVRDATPQ